MTFAVIGAGNGGQAVAAYLSISGARVKLYDRNVSKVNELKANNNFIKLCGKLSGCAQLDVITNDLIEAISASDIIFVTTTANAHYEIAMRSAPYLKKGQVIILNPGRTGGALEFKQVLHSMGVSNDVLVAETQTLPFACRLTSNGVVNVIGVKDKVFISALPASNTDFILSKVTPYFNSFVPAKNVLHTSLENIGAIFHPCVLLFNAATIERQELFWFYRDMTPRIANFIEAFDRERLAVGKAYGIDLLCVNDWISYAYPDTVGNTLCEKMVNNPAYYDIKSPSTIFTRQITEDIPTGVIPIMELGEAAGVDTPLMHSMVEVCKELLGDSFMSGRTLTNLGLSGLTTTEIIDLLS